MSFQAMAWAASQNIPTRDKFVLVMMANYADENGKCWPSLNRLAHDTSMSRSTIQLALKSLEASGLLKIENRSKDGVSLPNHYYLSLTVVYRGSAHHTDKDEGGIPVIGIGVYREPVGGIPVIGNKPINEPIINEPIKEKRAKRAFDLEDSDFEKFFWPEWPNKVGKPAALKAWSAAIKRGHSVETIMQGLEAYVSSKSPDRPWLNPATFLNQERFLDRPAQVHAKKPTNRILETAQELLDVEARRNQGNGNYPLVLSLREQGWD